MNTFEMEYGVDATPWTGKALTKEQVGFRSLMEATLADAMNRADGFKAEADNVRHVYGMRIKALEDERDRQLAEIQHKIDGCEDVAIRCSNTLGNFEAADEPEAQPEPTPQPSEPDPIPAFLRTNASVSDQLVAAVDGINSENEEPADV